MASLSSAALAKLGNYSLDTHLSTKAADQIGKDKPFLAWLKAHEKPTAGGLQFITTKVKMQYQSNFAAYSEDDPVSYTDRDPTRRAQWEWGEYHDGCTINESELKSNGFTVDDSKGERIRDVSGADKLRLSNLLEDTMEALYDGFEESYDSMVHQDGTQSAKDVPGLDAIVSLDPTSGTIGGFDRATNPWWQNHAETAIAAADVGPALHRAWRAIKRYRGKPDIIIAGQDFIDTARASIIATSGRQQVVRDQEKMKGLELSDEDLYFKGIPIQYDPTFDDLDDLLGPTIPWSTRCYMLDSRHLWYAVVDKMKRRNPERPEDVYAYFWALTVSGALVCNKMRAHAVLAVTPAS